MCKRARPNPPPLTRGRDRPPLRRDLPPLRSGGGSGWGPDATTPPQFNSRSTLIPLFRYRTSGS
ncbi:hypothetical protein GAY33_36060 [Azospirillum brasilense]|nr:hypothetical protein [Azospirillum argentinense]